MMTKLQRIEVRATNNVVAKASMTSNNPAYFYSIDNVPDLHRCIIEEALHIDWDINTPRNFQIVSINQGAFQENTVMYLIFKTGSGNFPPP